MPRRSSWLQKEVGPPEDGPHPIASYLQYFV